MKVFVQSKIQPIRGRADQVLKQNGDVGSITYGEGFIVKFNAGFIRLDDPSQSWHDTCSLTVDKLPPGTKITIVVE